MSYGGEKNVMSDMQKSGQVDHVELSQMHSYGTGDEIELSERLKSKWPEVQHLSSEELRHAERRLVLKIDLRLLPILIVMYMLNYLDRNNIASARLAGLETDLHLKGTQYQLAVSILFVGYILMQIPSNFMLDKIGKPAPYLCLFMTIWGVISTCTAATQSYAGLIVCRFCLGFIEAAFFPGVLFLLSSWYTKKELALRTAILYSGSLLSGMFSGLIAAGILRSLDYKHGLRAWRWLFIVEGSLTIGVAIIAYFILPNFPATTKWLTPQERQIAQWRLEVDAGEADEHQNISFGTGLRMAFTDSKTYVLIILVLGIVSAAGVTNFFPTVVKTLGYSNIRTLCLTAPPYALCTITALFNAWHSDRTGEKTLHIVIPLGVAVIAFIIAASTTTLVPRYLSMMLMVPGIYSGYVVALGWISNSIPRPAAKRSIALAAVNCISNGSSIYASYLYPTGDAPRFIMAMSINAGTCALAFAMVLILRAMLMRENRAIEAEALQHGGKYSRPKYLY